jgi:hypothetical protein
MEEYSLLVMIENNRNYFKEGCALFKSLKRSGHTDGWGGRQHGTRGENEWIFAECEIMNYTYNSGRGKCLSFLWVSRRLNTE